MRISGMNVHFQIRLPCIFFQPGQEAIQPLQGDLTITQPQAFHDIAVVRKQHGLVEQQTLLAAQLILNKLIHHLFRFLIGQLIQLCHGVQIMRHNDKKADNQRDQ